jgi:[CysO sulfur-carrier protein]-S-L-cysteine hydrolase
MVIPRRHVEALFEHSRREFPNEACGLLATQDGIVVKFYPVENADASPVHYRMEPNQQLQAMLEIDDRGWDLGAIFHSHTRTRAYPSQTDVGLAVYPDTLYVIVSLADQTNPDVRAFTIANGEIREQALTISDDTPGQ